MGAWEGLPRADDCIFTLHFMIQRGSLTCESHYRLSVLHNRVALVSPSVHTRMCVSCPTEARAAPCLFKS